MFKRFRFIYAILIGVILAMLLVYIRLPYYITKPGMAAKLTPYVQVEGGKKESGDFMLVTVSMGPANVINLIAAQFSKYNHISKAEEILQKGESDEEYQFRQEYAMKHSQNAAIYNAYKRANRPVSFQNKGILVAGVAENMPAAGKLKLGDVIVVVDEKTFETTERFAEYMANKKEGDVVHIEYIRNGKHFKEQLAVKEIPGGKGRVGIGVSIVTERELVADPKVKIDSHEIGGPSAGLMFTLEIYNQLIENDMTKGHEIAGTGTINEKGEVGPIGGIQQKVVAASDAGAEIFFAPNEKGAKNSNYKKALEAAKDIKTKMKIVPVDTLDDALAYLEKLPEKK
ncbi:SepM family pheromone-processing serine protease [Bacillus cytotoxicus]|uniref:SepM family pheromone-processing serine protease n=1 Tax=Bacillus cytotoxicus TaxID=580165 RepID=UPI000863F0AD|nr:SepM family pheromone-processing serine protease [Bacillus cytotoxicus]AWC29517.1 PDZ domain-containing protein [Bacillus cytotoxicus]AWC41648.1 PDZ domain-containing protein [Bacillus cytotoxicus]AWC49579.1 PDZ domain-containing protein [Bacillus cytotoxicus]AWC53593.1 PDZ domain-containing protein [Bacillus cytotoxicus]AWC57720.1 PDZ domain-containing protein [Bacillus cytotoxicus]